MSSAKVKLQLVRAIPVRAYKAAYGVMVEPGGGHGAPHGGLALDRGIQLIKQALLDLPPRHRQVFLLHVTQSMSYGTIARHLGISAKTVQRDIAMVLELCQSRITGRDR
jgi:AraC-like DNA-binding protein